MEELEAKVRAYYHIDGSEEETQENAEAEE